MKGNKDHPIALLFGALALFGAVLCFFAIGTVQGTIEGREQTSIRANYEQEREKALSACPQSSDVAGIRCVTEAIEMAHGQSIARQDLFAQQDMAKWSFWMMLLTGGSVAVSALGVWLVARNLEETRKAVQETSAATGAMIRQNELTEQAQRPYLIVETNVSPTEPDEQGRTFPVSFRYRNFGGTAAQILWQAHSISVLHDKNALPEPLIPGKRGRKVPNGEFVAPNELTKFASGGPILNSHWVREGDGYKVVEGPPPELAQAFDPNVRTFFHGFVVYADFEGRCYIRGFCFTYGGDKFSLSHPSEAHNYERRCNPDGTPNVDAGSN